MSKDDGHKTITRSGRVVGADEVRAVGRFRSAGPLGYRAWAVPNAQLRSTRSEALVDVVTYYDSVEGA